jgi:Flp pilus assembly pilin Flp
VNTHDTATSNTPEPPTDRPREDDDERGSLVTEYGLIAIVGATIASLVMKWASGGAVWQLFDAVTDKVRVLLGA